MEGTEPTSRWLPAALQSVSSPFVTHLVCLAGCLIWLTPCGGVAATTAASLLHSVLAAAPQSAPLQAMQFGAQKD